ncbi:MAG: rhomboid family intramembrane serine protease [Candidatus Woesearchaeota archaeon]
MALGDGYNGSVVKSESKIVFSLFLGLVKFPFIFLLALFGRRSFKDAFLPFRIFFKSLFEPKLTVFIIFLLFFCFVLSFIFIDFFDLFVLYPSDIFSLRFFSILTHGFLHGGVAHLLGNVLFIYVFGRVLESELGSKKFIIIYFFGLFFAAIFSSIVNLILGVGVGGIGASGALMALISASIILRPFYFTYIFLIPLPVFLIGWVALYSDISGILGGVDEGIGYFAHVGGFLSVFVLFYFLFKGDYKHLLKKGLLVNLATFIIFGVLYVVFFLK